MSWTTVQKICKLRRFDGSYYTAAQLEQRGDEQGLRPCAVVRCYGLENAAGQCGVFYDPRIRVSSTRTEMSPMKTRTLRAACKLTSRTACFFLTDLSSDAPSGVAYVAVMISTTYGGPFSSQWFSYWNNKQSSTTAVGSGGC